MLQKIFNYSLALAVTYGTLLGCDRSEHQKNPQKVISYTPSENYKHDVGSTPRVLTRTDYPQETLVEKLERLNRAFEGKLKPEELTEAQKELSKKFRDDFEKEIEEIIKRYG